MQVPFGTSYRHECAEMLSYPETWAKDFKWFDLEPFESELEIVDYERGRSAARFIAKDAESGIRYPVFLTDMMALIPHIVNGKVRGTWEAKKRGANYGIRLRESK